MLHTPRQATTKGTNMSARDELKEMILDHFLPSDFSGSSWKLNPTAAADAILEAGYAKPRVITTLGELIELEEGTVIQDEREVLVLRDLNDYLDWLDLWGTPCHVHLPATVLFTPEVKA